MPDDDDNLTTDAEIEHDEAEDLANESVEEPEVTEHTEEAVSEVEQPSETTPSDQFDEELLGLAEQAGWSRDEAMRFSSPADLERALSMFVTRQSEPAPAGYEPPQRPAQQRAPLPARGFEYKFEASDDYDPAVNKMAEYHGQWSEHTNKRFDEIEAVLGLAVDQIKRDQQVIAGLRQGHESQRTDVYLDALPGEYAEVFGNSKNGVKPGTAQWRKRREFADARTVLQEGYARKGLRAPSDSQLNDQALAMVCFDKQKTLARQRLRNQVDKRKTQVANRTTPRRTAPEVGTDAAIAYADQRLREMFGR